LNAAMASVFELYGVEEDGSFDSFFLFRFARFGRFVNFFVDCGGGSFVGAIGGGCGGGCFGRIFFGWEFRGSGPRRRDAIRIIFLSGGFVSVGVPYEFRGIGWACGFGWPVTIIC